MKNILLAYILCVPVLVNAQIFENWLPAIAVTDSTMQNRNGCVFKIANEHILIWERDINDSTTEICSRVIDPDLGEVKIVASQLGIRNSHPTIFQTDSWSSDCLLVYQTNKDESSKNTHSTADEDLMFMNYNPDGSFSQAYSLSFLDGDDTHLTCKQDNYTVAWENSGKILGSAYDPLLNTFSTPYTIEPSGANSPKFGQQGLSYLIPEGNTTKVKTVWPTFSLGQWSVDIVSDDAFAGICSELNCNNNFMGTSLCMQSTIAPNPSSLYLFEPGYGFSLHFTSNYNLFEPTIHNVSIVVKSGFTILGFVSDSLGQKEIFCDNFYGQLNNISNFSGEDRNPEFYTTYFFPSIIRINLVYESIRNGFSTLYYSHYDYLEGAINEKNSTKEIRFTPSPFQSQTSIELPAGNNYLIHIFNINGQKIRNLSSSLNSEGMHWTTWDGKTDEGFNVPSGVYFVVATDSFSTYSGKVIKM